MSLPIPDPETGMPPAVPRRRRITLSKIFSWAAAAAFAGLILLFVVEAGMFESLVPKPPEPQAAVENPEQLTVGASRYTGSDKERQPYWVEAKSGIQDANNRDLVHMETVTGEMTRLSGEVLSLNSQKALYDTKTKALDLEGEVKLESRGGFVAHMSRARVVLEDKAVDTDVPVRVTFDAGVINAQGMKISDDGKRILFFNGVKARFQEAPAPTDGSTAP
ncbi:MAG: LPS export ABC transporter periplasmic protein LptC [Aestuariivirgaceae bacterium]|nr:LPS export ABC transporter periplasmic protein LptC [Aestuariivirgaceae bacterium]